MAEAPRITVNEVQKKIDAGEAFTFIDTRNPQAFSESDSMLPGAIRLPLDQLEEKLQSIPKNKHVVTYCT
jgi:rhodanese-related sulfurtransferase